MRLDVYKNVLNTINPFLRLELDVYIQFKIQYTEFWASFKEGPGKHVPISNQKIAFFGDILFFYLNALILIWS